MSRLENLMILGIGMTVGIIIALLLLGLALDKWPRGGFNLMMVAGPLSQWVPSWLRASLSQEIARMGWPLVGATHAYWYMSRGAGLIGYLLLWAAASWGLLVSTKVAKDFVPAPFGVSLHEFLSLTALAFSGLHALILLGDRYIDFSLVDIIYPFTASYRPAWVGLGQLGFYLSAVLTLSFYVRKRIGPKTWRSLHYLTFLAYALVVVHGLTSGTDANALPVRAMYLGSGAVIIFIVYYRLLTIGRKRSY
jgi:predicted ferric reductase